MSALRLAASRDEFFERVRASITSLAWWLATFVMHLVSASIAVAVSEGAAVAYADARFFTISLFVNAIAWAALIGTIGNPFVDAPPERGVDAFAGGEDGPEQHRSDRR